MKILKRNSAITASLLLLLALTSCKKTADQFSEPYPVSNEGLGIKMDRVTPPQPSVGAPGTLVKVAVTGLKPYKDKLIFMFNGQKAEVTEVTESSITVKVPDLASTGVMSIAVDDAIVFGPSFKVNGLINLDPTFRVPNGANNTVTQVLDLSDGRHLIVGDFTNYNNKGAVRPINRIVSTFSDFSYDSGLRSGNGANGQINNIIEYNGKYLIAGGFSGYAQRTDNISNLTTLNSNGSIDTMGVHTFRRPDQIDTIKYFPRFNAGTDRAIRNLYKQPDNKIVVSGGFEFFISRRYDQPNRRREKDSVILDSIRMPQLLRINPDGTLDKTYRFNLSANEGFKAANGPSSTLIHTDAKNQGKILVYGQFTSFDGKATKNIIRLNADGTIDDTFKPGLGPDNVIYSVTYNSTLDRYMACGYFKTYNGKSIEYLAMLKSDGSLDESFVPKKFNGPGVSFAKQLSDGLVVVSGYFNTYNGVVRNGFMIINSKGEMVAGYNSTGLFNGFLSDVIETKSEDNKRALLLIGNIDTFDNGPVNNIIRIVLE
ncbi:IPT/TIG domain-containing protein [Pedobacter nutrimenti]|uniref:IPT/TIG domain-containing protein n=1 Tax=Pedobacter nutrimenti TaxID=1241337 RepID=UPI00292FD1F5|nr:IPT/TIG domain-containing protein [Pedobacter nutrimenti]